MRRAKCKIKGLGATVRQLCHFDFGFVPFDSSRRRGATAGGCPSEASKLACDGAPWLAAIDRMTNFVAAVLECAIGLLAGVLLGLLAGYRVGKLYANEVEPLYIRNLRELIEWQGIPLTFARNGAVLGAVAGLLLLVILNRRSITQKVRALMQTDCADPQQIAAATGISERRVRKVVGRLSANVTLPPGRKDEKDERQETDLFRTGCCVRRLSAVAASPVHGRHAGLPR